MEDILMFIVNDLKFEAIDLTKNRHDAQDLIQETCLRMWLATDRYSGKNRLDLELIARRTMKNIFIDTWRFKRRYYIIKTPDFNGIDCKVEHQKVSERDLSKIKEYMEERESRAFEALGMICNGYSYAEIAIHLKVGLNTALGYVRRARVEIGKEFGSYQNKYK